MGTKRRRINAMRMNRDMTYPPCFDLAGRRAPASSILLEWQAPDNRKTVRSFRPSVRPSNEGGLGRVLLLFDSDRGARRFPFDTQRASFGSGAVEGDREVLLRRTELAHFHLDAHEIGLFVIFGAPLAGLLVNDEPPLACLGHGIERVASRRNGFSTDCQPGARHQGGGFVRPGAPYFPERHQLAEDLPPLHPRAAVVNCDGLAVRKFASRGSRRTRPLALVLLSGANARGSER